MATAALPKDLPKAYAPLIGALKSMFENPKHADLTVKCGDRQWRVNKAIVCAQSSWFVGACEGEFKEAGENTIALKEDEPKVIEAVLCYMYNFDYSDEGHMNGQEMLAPIVFDVHVHVTADKYDIPSLAELAASKFKARAEKEWETPAFAEAAELVYTTPANSLCDTVVSVAAAHADVLGKKESGTHFLQVTDRVAALASTLWQRKAGATVVDTPGQLCTCPNGCGFSLPVSSFVHLIGSATSWCMNCGTRSTVSSWRSNVVL